ncbi:CocE/NonD family hydrolase [Salinirussus salinus]|uniref:CocE/NonD family hydrolase n=1 Tax=Salinirussus salinus TaxID=1198300 RepID=UPI0013576C6D|nr:CocE/NonD family hydrolase [Salinirussus salinus]
MTLDPAVASGPEYGVTVHQDVMVDTRDGTALATDVYRPADGTGAPVGEPLPALLVRTPYDKRSRTFVDMQGRWFAKRGYVVAIQDVRGRFESEGDFYLLVNEPEDGYDTVEWLADRDYCDGQVGTMGTSYMAWVQSGLATLDPPALSAMFVNQGAADAWDAVLRQGGAFELRWLTWALTIGGGFAKRALEDADVQRALADVDTRDVLASEPPVRGQSPLRHIPNYEEWVFDFMESDGTDELWSRRGVNFRRYREESADVPTVYSGAWYDSYTKATCDNFTAFADMKDSDHYLLMGPWTHGGTSSWSKPYSGEAAFGDAARVDFRETKLAFFDRYLKGADTWDREPVTYFRMGVDAPAEATARNGRLRHGGRWAGGEDWPLPDTEFRTYYAQPDGRLAPDRPAAEEASTTYQFDPADPVPTLGGNCSSYYTFEPREENLLELPLADRPTLSTTGRGGYDQRTRPETFGAEPPYGPLEQREDVLVFRTPPLEESVEIAGPIRVRVHASTDAVDTDFTAKLVDEYPPSEDYPGGFALNLCDGVCRARYRNGRREPDPVAPGEVYEFEVHPYPTANVFRAGHRIRLDVSSSNFPRYDVNHNTGDSPGGRERRVATNTVYHDRERPTGVDLPVQPRR